MGETLDRFVELFCEKETNHLHRRVNIICMVSQNSIQLAKEDITNDELFTFLIEHLYKTSTKEVPSIKTILAIDEALRNSDG